MSRDAILARVRAALADVTPPVLVPIVPATEAPLPSLLDRFTSEARAVGTHVHIVTTAPAAGELLATIARTVATASRLVAWSTPLAAAVVETARHRLPDLHVSVLGADAPATTIAAADIGVTEADCLIAASGTVVLRSANRHRAASLLPALHVVVAHSDLLVPDLGTALRRVRSGRPPAESCVTLITGPSRTADIEKKLVLGVHGPCALHVIVVTETRAR